MAGKYSSRKDAGKSQKGRGRPETEAARALNHEHERIQKWLKTLPFKRSLLAAAGWALFTQVFLITQVSGNAMFPAVKDGDLIIAFRLQEDYAKNDVIVYTADGQTHIGRIVARETDVVTLDDSGKLLVNGTNHAGEILYPTYAKEGLTYPFAVPEGHVFTLGDYRTQTVDSRDFGAVDMDHVLGKVITIVRRRVL